MALPTFYQAVSWLAAASGISAWMSLWSNWLYVLRKPDVKNPLDSPLKELSDFVVSLNSFQLFWFNAAVAVVLPLLSAFLLNFVPVSVFESLEPYWAVVAMIAFAFWQQQKQYASRPRPTESLG